MAGWAAVWVAAGWVAAGWSPAASWSEAEERRDGGQQPARKVEVNDEEHQPRREHRKQPVGAVAERFAAVARSAGSEAAVAERRALRCCGASRRSRRGVVGMVGVGRRAVWRRGGAGADELLGGTHERERRADARARAGSSSALEQSVTCESISQTIDETRVRSGVRAARRRLAWRARRAGARRAPAPRR